MRLKDNDSSDEVLKVISPTIGSIQNSISTTGVVEPQNRLEIKPPINGRIEEILVEEGQSVKTGDVLAFMSSTERAALLDAARIKDKSELEYWQKAYNATPLIAPIDGEVIVRAVEPGQTVSTSDAILVLSDRLIVKAQVDETDIGKVKAGQDAIISLDAYPEIEVNSKVNHISYESKIVNNVTIYEVDILPDSVPEVFRSGMSASVDIINKSKDSILIIPLEAVDQTKDGAFVLLGNPAKPTRQKIELGISDEENVEVVSGLNQDDKIIVKTQKYQPSKGNNSGGSPLLPFGRRR